MTTYLAPEAGPTRVPNAVGWAGEKKTVVGCIPNLGASVSTAPVTTGPLVGDIYKMVKLPKGAVIIGGKVFGSRASSGTSNGSIGLAFNVGLSGAFKTSDGTSYGATTASQALGITMAVGYEAVAGGKGDSGMNMPLGGLLYTLGPLTLSEDQWATITITTSAVSFISAAALSLEVEYYMGVHA